MAAELPLRLSVCVPGEMSVARRQATGKVVTVGTVALDAMRQADRQHLAWLARSFGRHEYIPLTKPDLEILVPVAEAISRYPGTHLFKEGEPAQSAYLIESGEVDIYQGDDADRSVVSRVGPGSMLGDIAMFRNGEYLSSARAVSRVRVYRFDRDRILPVLSEHPAISLRWLVAALAQLEETQRRVIRLMHKTVLGQVSDLLLEEGDDHGEIYLSQSTIATLLGVSRQSVNEALGRLRDQRLVETGYRHIRVLDAERLRVVSEG